MRGTIGFLLLIAGVIEAWAGGGPQNVLLIVNDQSANSLELGHYYASRHGVPQHNICHVSLDPALYATTNTFFQTAVVHQVRNHIEAFKLSNQIDYLVLSMDLPSRINEVESSTAQLFYGCRYAASYFISGCNLPSNTRNYYYKAERGFHHSSSFNGTNYYLSFSLTVPDVQSGKNLIDRALNAYRTAPTGTMYLVKNFQDGNRNIRYQLYENMDFSTHFFPNFPGHPLWITWGMQFRPDVMGYMEGSERFNTNNTFLAGALGDHLTSYGGYLPAPPPSSSNQATVWDWIRAGVAASYGTVNEPCAYLEKYPDPLLFFWYGRGFNCAESYWMSVANPYQGLFVGDPLTAPYAAPPVVSLSAPTSSPVSGVFTIQVYAVTNFLGTRPRVADIYLDGRFHTTLTNMLPSPGLNMWVEINNATATYTTVSGETLYDAVEGMAWSLNASNLSVQAIPHGDRLELIYTNYGYRSDGLSYHAGVKIGSASESNLTANPLSLQLIESIYSAREFITLNGTANNGDTVQCTITLTNRIVTSNTVVAYQGESAASVLFRLRQIINSNTILQGSDGVLANANRGEGPYTRTSSLDARTPGPEGYKLHVNYKVTQAISYSGLETNVSFTDFFNDNANVLTARGNILYECGRSPLLIDTLLDSTSWPNGKHVLRCIATEGSAIESQGYAEAVVWVSNSMLSCYLNTPGQKTAYYITNQIRITASASGAIGGITQVLFLVEGKPTAPITAEPFQYEFMASQYGSGALSVRAIAFDSSGASACSDEIWLSIETVAQAPLIRAATDIYSTSFQANWASANLATNYWLDVTTQSEFTNAYQAGYSNRLVGPLISCAVTGLLASFLYYYRVRAETAAGISSNSGITNVMTQPTVILNVHSEYGTADPSVGIHEYEYGTHLILAISSPVIQATTQYQCEGWFLTHQDPAEGTGQSFVVVMTNTTHLTWLWNTNYWLSANATTGGIIIPESSWQKAGTNLMVTGVASDYFRFVEWDGDIEPAGRTNNPALLLMNHPKSLTVQFTPRLIVQGVPEWWMARYGWTNNLAVIAQADADGDKQPTWAEYYAGTNPTNANSFLGMGQARSNAATEEPGRIYWKSEMGRVYKVHSSSMLESGIFSLIASNILATPPINVATDSTTQAQPRNFYRIEVDTTKASPWP